MSGNQILTISDITNETLRVLVNQLRFTSRVRRDYDDYFGEVGAKIGDTINIRKPPRYVGRLGQTLQLEDQTETSIPLQLNTQFGVDLAFTSKEMKLDLDDFSKRVLKPAIAVVANKVDSDGLVLAANATFNAVGVPGTTPAAALTYLSAMQYMDDQECPMDGERYMLVNPAANVTLVDALKTLFQKSDAIAEQYSTGSMGTGLGFEFAMTQNIPLHTVGALGGTPTMTTTANQSGNTINTTGWTASVTGLLNIGDIITIANVHGVNPQGRNSYGRVLQFTVTGQVNSDGSGNATIPIYPAIIGPISTTQSAQYQTVDALPAASAAITVLGAAGTITPCNLAFHRDAFCLGTADLDLPGGVDKAARVSDKDTGISIRMVRNYDIVNDRYPCRLDILYGWAALYPELACRVQG